MDEMYGLYQQTLSMAPSPTHDYPAFQRSFQDRTPPFESSHSYILPATAATASSSSAMSTNCTGSQVGEMSGAIRAKIVSHPLYPKLLHAYIDCQKIGAPPDAVNLFDEIFLEDGVLRRWDSSISCLSDDPELNEFMESYCELLMKYKADLERPFNDATTFLNNIETQLNTLCNSGTSRSSVSEEVGGSSEEDLSSGEVQEPKPTGNDRELKDNLMRKYSGYISSLKREFSSKKKKGKLPKEARQLLLEWWNIHNKWPYPTEVEKVALAESTGLDQKQINNWFINQRKRHWKPSEIMQFTIMDSLHGSFYMNN